MTKSILPLCLLLAVISLSACKDHNPKDKAKDVETATVTPANSPASPKLEDNFKIDDLKYAGAVVFELGTTGKPGDTGGMVPTSRIYFCVDKSGGPRAGQLDIDFKSLGVLPLRTVWTVARTGAVTRIWEVPQLTLDYSFEGKVETVGPYSYGEVHFKSASSNEKWREVFAADANSFPKPEPGDARGFNFEVSEGTLVSSDVTYYQANDQTFYIGATLHRFTRGMDNLAHAVRECEASSTGIFTWTGEALKTGLAGKPSRLAKK